MDKEVVVIEFVDIYFATLISKLSFFCHGSVEDLGFVDTYLAIW